MVINELQNNWELLHVEFAYNNSVSAATGLAPNEVHMGRLSRLPLTISECTGVAGHQSLARDHLAYNDLTTGRQQRAYDIVREYHALTVSRVERQTQPSPTHCARFPNSLLAAGRGCTIRLPPPAKARRRTRTPRFSRPSSRSTGRAPTKSPQLPSVPPLTPRTAPLSALSSYIWVYLPTCPAHMLAGAFRYNAASPVLTPMAVATCRSICQRS